MQSTRIISPLELEIMNHILGKDPLNCLFTIKEYKYVNMVNLKDPQLVEMARILWKNHNQE